ncbi:hypothetical protein IGS68_00645 [Skermanella sp. TT6]|uniref:Uncharacterized protein n=1 Tax=Skermanella cutis TaxID=2775420 RepID=A0ABX7B938_9PROT|nr:hypothetical protein [Skermanella sp. TT6]QQP89823.1 hypothetical protein IGS68_00645 [Skermanella sp. TT6]
MPIYKEAFYEGAAIQMLARSGHVKSIVYDPPFYLFNGSVTVLLKYTATHNGPWKFTFMSHHRALMRGKAAEGPLVIGLVCAENGVATLIYEAFRTIAGEGEAAIGISCFRKHGEHYEIRGPGGALDKKVAPSLWGRILEPERNLT